MTAAVVVAAAPALRAGLRAMLEQGGIPVTAEAAEIPGETVQAVLVIAGDVPPQDLEHLGGPVVVLTDQSRYATAVRDLGLPGWAVLPENARSELLLAAVTAAAQGLAALPVAAMANVGLSEPLQLSGPLQEPLTPRELEVLQLLSHGLPNKLIARQLGISEHTVKFHVSATFAKLGAASRTEAVSLAARRGLISL